jgi:hypothetical protein
MTEKEDVQVKKLKVQIENALKLVGGESPSITVKFGTKKWTGITGAEQDEGQPKSDFHLLAGKTAKCFISHKDGLSPSAFGQWGGITKMADGKVSGAPISKHQEVLDFVETVKKIYPNEIPRGITLARPIRSRNLKMMSVWGPAYGGKPGDNNCDLVLQGEITLTRVRRSNTYELDGSGHNIAAGTGQTGQWSPTLMVMYKGLKRKDHGITGARFSIYPKAGRSITEFI